MSTWHVTAIERLGAPDASWPSIYGPTAGTDPVAANGLHTLDLTPSLEPLKDFSVEMQRDLTTSSFSSMTLDLADADGSLADTLGPFSATLAAANRYFGPWVQVIEEWSTGSAVRFLGYIDEGSIQWSEDDARTQVTVLHASQLLKERLITDFPALLRPWPSVPNGVAASFAQSTADALLAAAAPAYAPRSNAAALEAALWTTGQLSWEATPYKTVIPMTGGMTRTITTYYPVPTALASSITIGSHTYAVDHIDWDPSLTDSYFDGTETDYFKVARIYLQGAPDLTGILTLGATVTWAIPESQRSHYLLPAGSIPAPASGSDGPKSIQLNTVEQLAAGDVLTLTFVDSSSGAPRSTTADLPVIVGLDGETATVHLATAISQGYANVSKVRRNSQDPVLFDGLKYAQALVAPFALDASAFTPAPTDLPVLVWQPYDVATPPLYGAHHLQTIDQGGALLVARRGADNGAAAYPTMGVWQGAFGGTWLWQGLPTADATHQIFGDVLQWPGGVNGYTAPVIYTDGDLSGGATIPPNGWRHHWRTWKDLAHQSQPVESTWDGTTVHWVPTVATGDVPAKLVAFAASTPTPGRYALAAGAWTFQAHSGNGTLAAAVTPTLTGAWPSGNPLALGMGIYAAGDEQEAILGLVATGAAYPFTNLTAVLMSQSAGGNLTVRQTQSLWDSTGPAWATGTNYSLFQTVTNAGTAYTCLAPHTSGTFGVDLATGKWIVAAPAGPWALGGGLVVQSWTETIGGLPYAHTRLIKLNGTTGQVADLKTLEIIPQTLQPLLLTGASGSRVVGGWYALALESYADQNYAMSRRLRFVYLDQSLAVVNGQPEPDPTVPTDVTKYFSRGDMVASLVPDGALIARMVRTNNGADTMAGLVAGRIFTIGHTLPTTVERLKIGATVPQGNTLDVSNSGDGLAASDYLEKFAAAQLANAIPSSDGNMALVSRAGGTVRLRTFGAQQASVMPSERGKRSKTQVWTGYLRRVRVTYTDILTGGTATVSVDATFDGGSILDLDLSDLVCSETMAQAVGQATVYWLGQPAPVINETWVDLSGGVQGDMAPAWWASWHVGDLVVLDPFVGPSNVTAWKLLKLQPGLEDRSVDVELRKQPFLISVGS
ncbi:MAG: hypothetical protein P4L11_13720 [Geothrix sp.]|nr:hypothetical protein [Geothrix sp.]